MTDYSETSALKLDPNFKPSVVGKKLSWACPQCQHSCVFELTEGVLYGLLPREESDPVVIECVCGEQHAGAPAGATGCGCFFGWQT